MAKRSGYHRILLKLSGETLAGSAPMGINAEALATVAAEIAACRRSKAQIAVVIGAGNLWRGAGKEMDRVTADYMGMLATVMNSLALCDALRGRGIPARVQSAIEVPKIADRYDRDRALELLDAGQVVVFAGGTGNPFFTTDTTAALRAAEIKADVLLKATQVDGVYSDDPRKNKNATRYDTVSFDEAIRKRLRIMDMTAFSLCSENNIPIVVFDFHRRGNLAKAVAGAAIGTTVTR